MTTKRILLVDDTASIRSSLKEYLEPHGLVICGEAGDGLEAIEKAGQLNPDVIVLDVSMPRMNGLQAIPMLKSQNPGVAIVMFTLHSSLLLDAQIAEAGADAVVGKAEGLDALLDRIIKLCERPPPRRIPMPGELAKAAD